MRQKRSLWSNCIATTLCCSILLLFVSCFNENQLYQEQNVTIHKSPIDRLTDSIPYASLLELGHYDSNECFVNDGVLCYALARDYAYVELVSNLDLFYPEQVICDLNLPNLSQNRHLITLSDRPVIVYDYDEKPYYYEFSVLFEDNRIIGTITVDAQPHSTELISYMFPSSLRYDSYDMRYHRYVGEYPDVYYRMGSDFYRKAITIDGDYFLVLINHSVTTNRENLIMQTCSVFDEEGWSMLENDLCSQYQGDIDSLRFNDLMSYLNSFSGGDEIVDFWENLSLVSPQSTSSFTLNSEMENRISQNILDIDATIVGFLDEYMDHRLRLTRWEDYCGPAALSWIYRGKKDSFEGKFLPLYGDFVYCIDYPDYHEWNSYSSYYMGNDNIMDNSFATRETKSQRTDKGLYNTFFKYCTESCGAYPLYDRGIRLGVEEATNNAYKIKFITTPISWIRDMHQPVLVEGIGGHPHYWAAIGYAYNTGWLGLHYKLRLFVTDNGSFSISHNNYPYWSILGGLNYAWEEI